MNFLDRFKIVKIVQICNGPLNLIIWRYLHELGAVSPIVSPPKPPMTKVATFVRLLTNFQRKRPVPLSTTFT